MSQRARAALVTVTSHTPRQRLCRRFEPEGPAVRGPGLELEGPEAPQDGGHS